MSKLTSTLPFAAAVALLWLSFACPCQGQDFKIDTGWKFSRHGQTLSSSTAGWEQVDIPHTWNAQEAHQGKLYRGACWYQRRLRIPRAWKGRRVFIRFEAASIVARTYINGHYLGEHKGAFTAFCYELTPYLHYGGKNDLRVLVDNSRRQDVPPVSGDFNMDGGLYRPVHLIVKNKVCITPLDFASPGVYLSTRELDSAHAVVSVRSLVSNGTTGEQGAHVRVTIRDAAGHEVASGVSDTLQLAAGSTLAFDQWLEWKDPHAWNGERDPYLYTADIRVVSGGKTVDRLTQPLGLKTVAISQQKGFLLNGKPYPIYGVAKKQDYGDQGWAMTEPDQKQDAQMILELGATAVRDAHYPMSAYWHTLCDHDGILLWDEVPLVNEIRRTPAFTANAIRQMEEMIHQLYNHPSIAFWGLFNEIGNAHTPYSAGLLNRLKHIARDLDTSRIIVAASDHGDMYYNQIPDAICYNTYPGWYKGGNWPRSEANTGGLDQFAGWIRFRYDETHKRIAISEYGAGGSVSQHEEDAFEKPQPNPGGPFHPEEWQTWVHEQDYRQIKGNPEVWGSFVWVMFDFAVATRHEGATPYINDKGLVTEDRKIRKDAFFFYKANWNKDPMVYIAARRLTPRKMAVTRVQVFSNANRVILEVNGRKLGAVIPDDTHVCLWKKVQLQRGRNQIRAVGYFGDKTVSDSCEWELQD
jgi:beta-galactosidase